MLAIYLCPDRTQILKVKTKSKNAGLEIVFGDYIGPYLEHIRSCDINQIIEMFMEVKAATSTKSEELYVVLPDHLFTKIDCVDFISQERLLEDLEKSLKLPLENLCIAYPINVQTGATHRKTVCVIERELIDVIVTAAKEADVTLVSAEPASMAYFRSVGQWQTEKFAFLNYGETTSIASYSPIAGYYSYVLTQNISKAKIEENAAEVNAAIDEVLIKSDNINQVTFGMANPDIIEVHMLADAPQFYKALPALANRQVDKNRLPDFVKHEIDPGAQGEWTIAVGTLLQEIPEAYMGSVEFMHFAPANVVPDEARSRSRFEQLRKTMKKYSVRIIIAACVVLCAELSAIAYYSFIEIPASLQQEYGRAQKELTKIENELKIIAQSQKEDQQPLEALRVLVSEKPPNIGFTTIEIGDKQSGAADKNSKKIKWVTFAARTVDPMMFQDYTARLSEQPIFAGVSINQISSDSNGTKSARVTVWKGKVE